MGLKCPLSFGTFSASLENQFLSQGIHTILAMHGQTRSYLYKMSLFQNVYLHVKNNVQETLLIRKSCNLIA